MVLPSTVDEPIYGLAVTPEGSTLGAPFFDDALGEDVLGLIPLRDGVTARSIRLGSRHRVAHGKPTQTAGGESPKR